eukprot:TRINITY_DN3137_c5_g1_i1.p1 TRINITY_DN3137_c5_g1~~TRINITY_DN3137_c5_g1_i1.p1  ORF type:complete len:308 (+),score=83.75 TRINITY_DN3137_c5_g1_i1:76-924(+)
MGAGGCEVESVRVHRGRRADGGARKEAALGPGLLHREAISEAVSHLFSLATVSPQALPDDDSITVFDADPQHPPVIKLAEYLKHWLEHSECSIECAVIAVAYVLRTRIPVNVLNQHRLLLGALMVAVKWRDDLYFANNFYSGVGGVSIVELNRLETGVLNSCDWRMTVDCGDYDRILRALQGCQEETDVIASMLRQGSSAVDGPSLFSSGCSEATPALASEPSKVSVSPIEEEEEEEVEGEENTWSGRASICHKVVRVISSRAAAMLWPGHRYEAAAKTASP